MAHGLKQPRYSTVSAVVHASTASFTTAMMDRSGLRAERLREVQALYGDPPAEAELDFEAALAEACRVLRTAGLIDNVSLKTRVWFAGHQMAEDDMVSNIVSTAQRANERK